MVRCVLMTLICTFHHELILTVPFIRNLEITIQLELNLNHYGPPFSSIFLAFDLPLRTSYLILTQDTELGRCPDFHSNQCTYKLVCDNLPVDTRQFKAAQGTEKTSRKKLTSLSEVFDEGHLLCRKL